ncbi:DUF6531 domain-containing protein, partial [Pseudomonas agarici]|uniref:DUF6531 domain-containing protein n=1 Tax=Pseudomonas agarici TaxID=46677 RepID=UPI001ABF41BC
MTDTYWAAREGDALLHTAPMADLLGGVLEIAASVAVGALATTAVVAATGITVATGGLGCLVLGSAVGIAVGVGMNQTGTDEEVKQLCDWLSNALFPPTVQAHITTGSPDTFINGKPAARAAGRIGPVLAGESAGYLDIAQGFFSQLWRPTVATPAPGAIPSPYDRVACDKHPPMPQVYLAEGSSKVTINGQPAVRTGDRSTCEARVGAVNGLISPNVRIGGAPVVIREIRSGKPPGVGLAVGTLLMLRGGGAKFFSQLPCMLVGGLTSWGTGQVSNALSAAMSGSPNPVHAATGAKVLGGEDELDFALPGLLPLDWQRFYNSRDERHDSLLGQGWSLPYEINVRLEARPEGGERLIYTDEQARQIDMGSIPLGHAVFSAGEGLSVRRHDNGQLLIESEDGLYRLFEPTLADPSRLRLSQLGDRNDNRLYLDYSKSGTLIRLRDTFDQVQVELIYHSPQGPRRIGQIERLYPDQTREVLVSYDYDAAGDLSEVRDATGQVQRRFAYDEHRRLVEHQLPSGLRCFYQWALIETQETQETQKTQKTQEWRVTRHWTDDGDDYQFDYDLEAGITRITDGLRRVSTLQWNRQYQITAYTDPLGHTWQFQWNDERQLLGAIDPQDGHWRFSYDASGNLSTSEDPLGRIDSTLWLEHWSLPQVQTDAAGQAWQYRYDQRGNCLSETDPLGHTTTYRYDAFGQVVEIIDATGKSRTLRWNECGQLTYHADCSDYPTDFYYDRRGHLCTVADAFGERVHYQRDAQGRLLQTERPVDRFDHYQRDAHGQLIAHIDAAGGSTRYQYNRRGQVRQRTDALGRQIEYHYDAYGRLQALTNENGESYRFAWDANDRRIRQQDLDGSARQYSYDTHDNVVAIEHLPAPQEDGSPTPAPIVHQLERDALGRLIAKITADGRTTYSYDRLDQVT